MYSPGMNMSICMQPATIRESDPASLFKLPYDLANLPVIVLLPHFYRFILKYLLPGIYFARPFQAISSQKGTDSVTQSEVAICPPSDVWSA